MFKDLAMRVFFAHLVAYVAVTAISAAINFWLTPNTLWWPWVLIGWGVAVAIHAFALLLRKTRRRERIFVDRKARAFAVHLFAYAAIVIVLFYVNIALTPKVWWFYWVALGWGVGVAFHAWCTFLKRRTLAAAAPQGTVAVGSACQMPQSSAAAAQRPKASRQPRT
jgi:hypothetical protein